jgi:hypothetical protein
VFIRPELYKRARVTCNTIDTRRGPVTLCIALIALVSSWRVRSTGEFSVAGRRTGWTVVSGIIVGGVPLWHAGLVVHAGRGCRLRAVGDAVRHALAATVVVGLCGVAFDPDLNEAELRQFVSLYRQSNPQ